jgi:crossover junction endodeoxyribonuclease RusA
MISLDLPYPPSANRLVRASRARVYKSKDARDFATAVAIVASNQMRLQGQRPMPGNLKVEITLHRPRKSGDVDNRIKPILDALNGVAYVDDSQIVSVSCCFADPEIHHHPRAFVLIRSVSNGP